MKNKLLLFLLSAMVMTACGDRDPAIGPRTMPKTSDEPETPAKPDTPSEPEDEDYPCAYGTPTARFTIKGRVTDAAGNPVGGIRITPVESWYHQIPTEWFIPDEEYIHRPFYEPEAVYTDKTGAYIIHNECFDHIPFFVVYRAEDVDGPDGGGEFAPHEAETEITEADRTAQGNWISEYTKEGEYITLTEQK